MPFVPFVHSYTVQRSSYTVQRSSYTVQRSVVVAGAREPVGMAAYVVVLAVAAGCTLVLTEVVRRLAVRLGAVDRPDEARVHERPTATLGGVAMYLGFLAALVVASRLDGFAEVFRGSSEPLGVVLAATVVLAVGIFDDVREASQPAKLAGTVLAGGVLYLLGTGMLFFRVPFVDVVVLSPDLAPLVTVLWVVGMTQALNLIDGLDGLAAGIVAIAAGAFFLYANQLADAGLLAPENGSRLLAVIALGVCLGFLPHNFHPARIFMGDTGALFLGVLMAASTMMVGGRTDDPFSGQTFFFFAPLFIPLVILGVPILDTLFAIVRRTARRSSAAIRDIDHLHHRLMRIGHGQRRAVLILWTWTAILSGFVLYPIYTGEGNHVVPFGVVALGVILYTVLHPEVRRTRSAGQVRTDAPEGEPEVPSPAPGGAPAAGTDSAAVRPGEAAGRDPAGTDTGQVR